MKIKGRLVLLALLFMICSVPVYGAQIAPSPSDEDISAQALPNMLNAKEIYEKCSPAVFYIETYDMNGDPLAKGSGFFIDDKGTAVTNLHVLDGAFSAKAILTNAKELPVTGIFGMNVGSDLAVIQVEGQDVSYLPLGDSSKMKGGERIYTIGSPMGLSNTISEGIISNPNRMVGNTDYIQISAPISHGSSGGALINDKGQVIGVTTAGYMIGQNLNFAVPINVVRTILNESSDLHTMEELVQLMAQAEYNSLPEAFTYIVDEEEPNNTPSQAQYIENGTSIIGVVDQKTADYFYAACNMPGTVSIYCFSIGDGLREAQLMVSDDTGEYSMEGTTIALSDGDVALACDLEIPKACYVDIMITRKDIRRPLKQDIDYIFYYEFIPAVTP